MSTFRCEVVPVELKKHPNADSLSLVQVWGYTVVVRTEEWLDHSMGVYIPPESVHDGKRITVKRLRGVYSHGMLVHVPPGVVAQIGEDFAERLGVTHYEPPTPATTGGEAVEGPSIGMPRYDVESYRRYAHLIPTGTPVYVTEKIHGASARYVWHDGTMHVGSRTEWKGGEGNPWSRALDACPWITAWCRWNPSCVVYGEVFGAVQSLRYGKAPGEVDFRAFDVWKSARWVEYLDLCKALASESRAPVLFEGPMPALDVLESIVERDSVLCPGQVMEGIVICTQKEQWHPEIGRVQLKLVSNRYLES